MSTLSAWPHVPETTALSTSTLEPSATSH